MGVAAARPHPKRAWLHLEPLLIKFLKITTANSVYDTKVIDQGSMTSVNNMVFGNAFDTSPYFINS